MDSWVGDFSLFVFKVEVSKPWLDSSVSECKQGLSNHSYTVGRDIFFSSVLSLRKGRVQRNSLLGTGLPKI